MAELELDVVGIGNAIVDVLSHAEERFVNERGLAKGSMTLIDMEQAEALYAAMGPAVEVSGGSAANTIAGIAALGGRTGFIGKVRNDQLGGIFRHDIRAGGTLFTTPAADEGPPTARCLIFVTPDAQRTMCTYLGASVEFGPDDVDFELVKSAKVTYLEGYLWDAEPAKRAFVQAAEAAHAASRTIALSLSDPFCVERHRSDFIDLVENHIDILFANEAEITSLYQTERFDEAAERLNGKVEIALLTRSEKGSVVVYGDQRYDVPAVSLGTPVDTTGAGDLYAAGFLYGYTQGKDLPTCARIGAIAAGEVITHMGPRPERNLQQLLSEHLTPA